jgi:hypothetical protein
MAADLRSLEDSRMDLARCVVLPQHLFVGSGRAVVAPLDDTLGVGAFHAPPITAPFFALRAQMLVNGIEVHDSPSGFRLPEPTNTIPRNVRPLLQRRRLWQLDRIIRIGHAHYRVGDEMVSFEVTTQLLPLVSQHGFVMSVTVLNRGSRTLDIAFTDSIEPGAFGTLPWSDWVWMPPKPVTPSQRMDDHHFRAGDVDLNIAWDATVLRVEPGEEAATAVRCIARVSTPIPALPVAPAGTLITQCTEHQAGRLQRVTDQFPSFASNHDGLSQYWRRCLVTGMTCLWDHEQFKSRPHVATSGLDGGAICTYLWDTSYAPLVLHLIDRRLPRAILDVARGMDIGQHFAFTPDGAGTGPWYAANDQSLTELIWTTCCVEGVDRDLVQFLQEALHRSDQRLPSDGQLRDFGTNRNLLEMRTNGYEHVVPCFNSLRAMNLRRLATLLDLADLPDGDEHRAHAHAIEREVRHRLWDPQRQWFDCLHPDGSRHHVDSIRVFGVLLAGVATRSQERTLVARVVEGDFLDTCGVHSVSPQDAEHFELVDVDWSGNGAFIGEPPLLAYTLWRRGYPQAAWSVLQRLLWMGTMLPYLPQEAHAQKPSPSPRGLANICASVTGIRAILSGMLGFEVLPDGTMTLRPQVPPGVEVELRNLRIRDAVIDVNARHRGFEVSVNGKRQTPTTREGKRCVLF